MATEVKKDRMVIRTIEESHERLLRAIFGEATSPITPVADGVTIGEALQQQLSTLLLRQERVLVLRFGLEDGRSRILEEVGRDLGVTRARIRQIEVRALHRLRHPTRSRPLRPFFLVEGEMLWGECGEDGPQVPVFIAGHRLKTH
ncbi:hypothetical protein LCGC14_1270250 [marine sediment metagenome]|uniref:RNA polymerase sigma-70 region 4 domain-containing protein n=1 Tax=marine sediment metagenome TaxID=412755 RepID=A0A0F9KYB7_9ZZZZ